MPKIKENDGTSLEISQQRWVSPYDIHYTLLDIFWYHPNNKIFSRKGQSIYNEINVPERNCNYYSQDIILIWCRWFDF